MSWGELDELGELGWVGWIGVKTWILRETGNWPLFKLLCEVFPNIFHLFCGLVAKEKSAQKFEERSKQILFCKYDSRGWATYDRSMDTASFPSLSLTYSKQYGKRPNKELMCILYEILYSDYLGPSIKWLKMHFPTNKWGYFCYLFGNRTSKGGGVSSF